MPFDEKVITADSKLKSHATMGLAKVISNRPENYLKKGAGIRRIPPLIGNARVCLLSSRRPPISSSGLLPTSQNRNNDDKKKYYIRRNIVSAASTSGIRKSAEAAAIQDTRDGHRQILDKSGLTLKYVFKKEYGKVPNYLNKRFSIVGHWKKQNDDSMIRSSPLSSSNDERVLEDVFGRNEWNDHVEKVITEEEKQTLLSGLKENLRVTEKKYALLPVITDTLSRRRRRQMLEDQIKCLERDIRTLEINHPIVVVKDNGRAPA